MITAVESARAVPRSNVGEDMLTVVGAAWMIAGLFLDGYAHQNLLDGEDSFFTPYHAVFYGTYIMLFLGALLIVTAPLHSAWDRRGSHDSWPNLIPAVASMTLTMCLVGFFLAFLWGTGFDQETRTPYDPATGAGEVELIAGVATALVSTAVIFGGMGLMARRWRLPAGAAAVLLVVPDTAIIATFDHDRNGITAMFVTALIAEIWLARPDPDMWWPTTRRVLVVGPAILWLAIFGLRSAYDIVAWQTELWTGTVILCAMTGAAIGLVLDPPRVPPDDDPSVTATR